MQKVKIIYVDDDPLNHLILESAIGEMADVITFDSGESALAGIPKHSPDVILLDVEMPEMDGYAVCRQLKMLEATQNIPILFLSSHGDLDSKISGYEAGAEDYIVKPFESDVLVAKVKALAEYKLKHERSASRIEDLEKTASEATHTAMAALNTTGDIGLLVAFMERSQECDDFRQLGTLLLDCIATYQIKGNVQIRVDKTSFEIGSDGFIIPLHADILSNTCDKGRVFTQNKLMTVNYEQISVLIQNMPTEDENQCGRLRDIVVQLVNVANDRVKSLTTDNLLFHQHQEMGKLVLILKKLANSSESQLCGRIDEISESIENIAGQQDMPETYEKELTGLVRQIHSEFTHFYTDMSSFENKFMDLVVYEQKIMSLLKNDSRAMSFSLGINDLL